MPVGVHTYLEVAVLSALLSLPLLRQHIIYCKDGRCKLSMERVLGSKESRKNLWRILVRCKVGGQLLRAIQSFYRASQA